MIFKDSEGREYEYVRDYTDKGLVVRPVKQEPKYTVDIFPTVDNEGFINIDYYGIREDQAQLIKQSVESLMYYLMGDSDIDLQALASARQAIKGDK